MLIREIPVDNPAVCPFRYCDQEWGTYACSLQEEGCDQGTITKTPLSHSEPMKGVTLARYKEEQVFLFPPSCPFNEKPFIVSVEQD